jgi:hypothetical protein
MKMQSYERVAAIMATLILAKREGENAKKRS